MVDKRYSCDLCRETVVPQGTAGRVAYGFRFVSANPTRIELTGINSSERHLCVECIKAIQKIEV